MPKSKFAQQVADASREQKTKTSQYGHLNIPRGVPIIKETGGSRLELDFLPYKVTDPKHPDRKDETERAIPGALWYRRPYRLHRGIGVNNESVVCPTSVGKRCPICEYRKKLMAKNADKDDISAVTSRLRNLYVVIPLNHKDYEEKPSIWDISHFLFQEMLDAEMDEDPEGRGIFPDLEEGLTLKIRFSEETMGKNKFGKASRIDFLERKKGYSEKILKDVPNLDEVLRFLTYEEIEEKFHESKEEEPSSKARSDDDDDDGNNMESSDQRREKRIKHQEDEDEEPVKPKRRLSKDEDEEEPKPKSKKHSDDDDEEEPKPKSKKHSDDEDEEPVKPKRRLAKDEDDDDEKPTKKVKATTCPYDYEFGADCEKYEECETCKVWEACYEAKEALKGKGKSKHANDDDE